MGSNTAKPGGWNQIRNRFQRVPQRKPDVQLRSDVENCIALLRTSNRRAAQTGQNSTPADLISTPASAANCNAFGLRLLRRLVQPRTYNVFFSPCGIALALNMVMNGARGETRKAMERALGLSNTNLDDLNRDSANLIRTLAANTEETQVHIASSLWIRHLERMVPEFMQCCQSHYEAEIGDLGEGATPTFRAARLPYRDGFHMTVLLPHSGVPFQEMMALLTPENWEALRTQFRAVDGRVGLPRFRFDYLTGLQDTLTQMGMGIAFEQHLADFTGMSLEFYLGEVIHKAYVEVNEEGTTAAAVTAIEALYTGILVQEPEDRFTLILDRPFCCAIEDEQTAALLFLGAIMAP